jgi:hypothetical protein
MLNLLKKSEKIKGIDEHLFPWIDAHTLALKTITRISSVIYNVICDAYILMY